MAGEIKLNIGESHYGFVYMALQAICSRKIRYKGTKADKWELSFISMLSANIKRDIIASRLEIIKTMWTRPVSYCNSSYSIITLT